MALLPTEIWMEEILCRNDNGLSYIDLVNIGKTCKLFREMIDCEMIWMSCFKRCFFGTESYSLVVGNEYLVSTGIYSKGPPFSEKEITSFSNYLESILQELKEGALEMQKHIDDSNVSPFFVDDIKGLGELIDHLTHLLLFFMVFGKVERGTSIHLVEIACQLTGCHSDDLKKKWNALAEDSIGKGATVGIYSNQDEEPFWKRFVREQVFLDGKEIPMNWEETNPKAPRYSLW